MPKIRPFLPAHRLEISVHPPTLLHHYRKSPPAALRNFTNKIRLGSPGCPSLTYIPPPDFELGTDEIDKLIDTEAKSVCNLIKTFLKSPEPPTWIPPSNATPSVHEFLTNLRIPSYSNGSPSLLLHNLDMCNSSEIKKIFRRRRHMFICNTPGSGKTRRILEGLTKYWGFYFVASRPGTNDISIPDLAEALVDIAKDPQWVSDLHDVSPDNRAAQNDLNSRIASVHFQKVLAARIIVFKLFLQVAIKADGELLEKHKRLWLLFQLSTDLSPEPTQHPFFRIMKNCLPNASRATLESLVSRLPDIREKYSLRSNFIIGLDEAKRAARSFPCCFLSSDSNTYHSIIHEIAQVFTSQKANLVVSCTGQSPELVAPHETFASGVSNPVVFMFHDLGMFDNWPKLKSFIENYPPLPSFNSLLATVCKNGCGNISSVDIAFQ